MSSFPSNVRVTVRVRIMVTVIVRIRCAWFVLAIHELSKSLLCVQHTVVLENL